MIAAGTELVVASTDTPYNLVDRLRTRARIRRQILTRKSVAEGKPDRLADLLEEAAEHIQILEFYLEGGHKLQQ